MIVSYLQLRDVRGFVDSGPLALGAMNLLVGKNNSGKSTVLRALSTIQEGATISPASLVRDGRPSGSMSFELLGVEPNRFGTNHDPESQVAGNFTFEAGSAQNPQGTVQRVFTNRIQNLKFRQTPNSEPHNFIYPYFSNRKVSGFAETVNLPTAELVANDLSNLAAKVDLLGNPAHPQYPRFRQLIQDVIGLEISATPSSGGKQVGVYVSATSTVPLDALGDGIAQMLGLIVQLCVASGDLFLIEEIENDIHPEALKALLKVVGESSEHNQFIISTHNNLVVRHLGSLPGALIYEFKPEQDSTFPGLVSTVPTLVEETLKARVDLLNWLGYELSDQYLHDGWLIFEESSAERIVLDVLIPNFARKLQRVRTVAANGTGDLDRSFAVLQKLVLFTHLEPRYHGRIMVIADGEASGIEAISKLRSKFSTWDASAFRTLGRSDFEKYYPIEFQEEVARILALPSVEKRIAKKALLDEVLTWAAENPERAVTEFEQSASEVIEVLREFEQNF